MAGPGDSLWSFALRLYGRPGVPEACLLLQDEAGVDVPLLIAALFAARHGTPLTRADCDRLAADMAGWREHVIAPLRGVRRWLKPGQDRVPGALRNPFRDQVKALELEAERLQLGAVEAWLSGPRDAGPAPALAWFTEGGERRVEAAFALVAGAAALD